MNVNHISQNRQETSQHPWHVPYSPQCICAGCQSKPYWDGKIYYSLCLGCLQKKELGPFKKRYHKDNDYYSLFWTTDYERDNAIRKETLQ